MRQRIIALCVCFGILFGSGQAVMAASASADQIKAVQQALNEAGYNCGKVDGLAGKKTEAAVRAFEKDKGLPVDGVIDGALLELLGITEETQTEEKQTEEKQAEEKQAEEAEAEEIYSSCRIGELVFEVPEKWVNSGSAEGADTAAAVFTVKEDPKTTVSITVSERKSTAEDAGDQALKELAEEVIKSISGRSYDGKAEVYTLSDGCHAAVIRGGQDSSGADAGQKEEWLFCTFTESHAVSVLLTSMEPDVFSGGTADALDRVLTSCRKDTGA